MSPKQPNRERMSCGNNAITKNSLLPIFPEAPLFPFKPGGAIVIIHLDDLEYGPSAAAK